MPNKNVLTAMPKLRCPLCKKRGVWFACVDEISLGVRYAGKLHCTQCNYRSDTIRFGRSAELKQHRHLRAWKPSRKEQAEDEKAARILARLKRLMAKWGKMKDIAEEEEQFEPEVCAMFSQTLKKAQASVHEVIKEFSDE